MDGILGSIRLGFGLRVWESYVLLHHVTTAHPALQHPLTLNTGDLIDLIERNSERILQEWQAQDDADMWQRWWRGSTRSSGLLWICVISSTCWWVGWRSTQEIGPGTSQGRQRERQAGILRSRHWRRSSLSPRSFFPSLILSFFIHLSNRGKATTTCKQMGMF